MRNEYSPSIAKQQPVLNYEKKIDGYTVFNYAEKLANLKL